MGILVRLRRHKKLNFYMKNILYSTYQYSVQVRYVYR
jgi:hypothetical protein